jgi:hypothetical protein
MRILDWLLAGIIAGVVGYIFWVNFIKETRWRYRRVIARMALRGEPPLFKR